MPIAALGLFVVVSVESFKASARAYYRRQSRKHGYSDLPTDSLGRPLNERGERISRNQARALTAHKKEIERIRTAEREWRLEGERLPDYNEAGRRTQPTPLNENGQTVRIGPGAGAVRNGEVVHDGMDWRRATWEGSPVYVETEIAPITRAITVERQIVAA